MPKHYKSFSYWVLFTGGISCLILLSGCLWYWGLYAPVRTPIIKLDPSRKEKIEGNWGVIVSNKGVINYDRKAGSIGLCFVTFKSLSSSIKNSFKNALENVYENVIPLSSIPSKENMQDNNMQGVVIIEFKDFITSMDCNDGFIAKCYLHLTMDFGIEILDTQGRLIKKIPIKANGNTADNVKCGDMAKESKGAYRKVLSDILLLMTEEIFN